MRRGRQLIGVFNKERKVMSLKAALLRFVFRRYLKHFLPPQTRLGNDFRKLRQAHFDIYLWSPSFSPQHLRHSPSSL